jgi:hypothetical protein
MAGRGPRRSLSRRPLILESVSAERADVMPQLSVIHAFDLSGKQFRGGFGQNSRNRMDDLETNIGTVQIVKLNTGMRKLGLHGRLDSRSLG